MFKPFLINMDKNEIILGIVKERGPILPVHVSKQINDDILMTSARLSELLTLKHIKISNLKVGGSPLYYFPGQEYRLQNFVENLQGVEKKAYDILRQKKIMKDTDQEPAIRVSLRQIKDFAVPLQVNYDNKSEIFWKWYLTDNKDAELLIKNILSTVDRKTQEELIEKPIESKKEQPKEEIQKEIIKDPIKKPKKIQNKNLFSNEVNGFFRKNQINIIEKSDTKKISEIDFVVGLQTTIGIIKYFCKSKNKTRINDADLSSAVIQSQSKGLPLLFLTNGILTKKAEGMLSNEFKNITYKKIQ